MDDRPWTMNEEPEVGMDHRPWPMLNASSIVHVHRWVEVASPSSTNPIALVPPAEGKWVGGDRTLE
jgi:hypothetical protein